MADRRWVVMVAAIYLAITLIPQLVGSALAGDRYYTGFDVNPDDMCVYGAWMEQARRGHFFFDNRFTTEPQPRLTVHLLFYALGTVERWTGLEWPVVFHLARILFGFLFLLAAWRLICRSTEDRFYRRLMFGVLLVGGGFGWTMLGAEGATGPTDLWQPEGFTFPSLMTNALFACSLWLIVEVWLAVLDAKDSWKPVARGFLAMLVLGNIHTYDVLGIGVTAVAFAGCLGAARLLTLGWFIRALVICAGAVPPAMWLKHVIDTDAVFAARAATLTFSPGIWQFLMGYAPLLVLAVVLVILTTEGSGLSTPQSEPRSSRTRRRASLQLGIWLIPLTYAALAIFGGLNQSPTMQTVAGFCAGFIALCLGAMALTSGIKVDRNHRAAMILLLAWATVSLWLPYFPGLFQRKLTMGSQIPLSLLAGLGLGMLLQRGREHGKESRPLTVLALAVLSISNWLWLTRSLDHITTNVASTGIHPVFLDREQKQALDWLRDNAPEDAAVLDLTFYACFIPAFAGQRTIGSHWSETPDFGPKFNLINRGIYGLGGPALRLNARLNLARETGANYAIWHKSPETDTNPLTDFSSLGPILFDRPELAIVANSETFPHGS